MMTEAFIGKLFSELKLVTDNLPLCAKQWPSFTSYTLLHATNLGVAVGMGLRSCPGWTIGYKVFMCGHTPPLLPFTITWYTFELEQLHIDHLPAWAWSVYYT